MELSHEHFMSHCIELAKRARENGFYPVGSILVQNNQIISEAYEGESLIPAPVAHAEIVAVLKAIEKLETRDLSDCILYTTKEPCFMCSYLIRQTQIQGIIYASEANHIGGDSSKYPILTANDISTWEKSPFVIKGILEEECREILGY